MPAAIDLTGQRFGRLTAVQYTGHRSRSGHRIWLCRCQCGRYAQATSGDLRFGGHASCGCSRHRDDESGRFQ